jgi:hypothetical protein
MIQNEDKEKKRKKKGIQSIKGEQHGPDQLQDMRLYKTLLRV